MEAYKQRKRLNKILDFLETFPEVQRCKKNYYFSEAVTETVLDFLEKDKNFRYYPWIEKIHEKRKELFGF